MTKTLPLALLLLAGCSDASSHPGAPGEAEGPCAERSGSYLVTFAEQSGDCGERPDEVVSVTSSSKLPAGCTGESREADQSCSITLDVTCVQSGQYEGWKLRENGTVHWSEDASAADGTLQATITRSDGSLACKSVYRVGYKRQ